MIILSEEVDFDTITIAQVKSAFNTVLVVNLLIFIQISGSRMEQNPFLSVSFSKFGSTEKKIRFLSTYS